MTKLKKMCFLAAPILLLVHPQAARADIDLSGTFDAVFNALPSWIFTILVTLFSALFDATLQSTITAIDFNGDGI